MIWSCRRFTGSASTMARTPGSARSKSAPGPVISGKLSPSRRHCRITSTGSLSSSMRSKSNPISKLSSRTLPNSTRTAMGGVLLLMRVTVEITGAPATNPSWGVSSITTSAAVPVPSVATVFQVKLGARVVFGRRSSTRPPTMSERGMGRNAPPSAEYRADTVQMSPGASRRSKLTTMFPELPLTPICPSIRGRSFPATIGCDVNVGPTSKPPPPRGFFGVTAKTTSRSRVSRPFVASFPNPAATCAGKSHKKVRVSSGLNPVIT